MNKRALKRTFISAAKSVAAIVIYSALAALIVLISYGLAMALSKYTVLTCLVVVVIIIGGWLYDTYKYECRVDRQNNEG